MDQSSRPSAAQPARLRRSRREHPVFNFVVGIGAIGLGLLAFTPSAQGPAFGVAVAPALIASASIDRSGVDVVITGSVDAMFKALGTFTGPNREGKQDRARIIPSAMEFAGEFTEVRTRMASMRASVFAGPTPASPQPKPHNGPTVRAVQSVSVASIGPISASAALTAIDSAAPGAPMPVVLSEEMAYARADTPVTKFDGSVADAKGRKVSAKELWCLSQAIYFESRGEAYRGQVAVAQVVMNRLEHKLYPGTICGVVFQNQNMRNACQFSFACDGIPERVTDAKSWKQAEEIAKGVVSGQLYLTEVGHATHYHATYVYPAWAPRMKKVTKVGLHVFYQFKRNWRFG